LGLENFLNILFYSVKYCKQNKLCQPTNCGLIVPKLSAPLIPFRKPARYFEIYRPRINIILPAETFFARKRRKINGKNSFSNGIFYF